MSTLYDWLISRVDKPFAKLLLVEAFDLSLPFFLNYLYHVAFILGLENWHFNLHRTLFVDSRSWIEIDDTLFLLSLDFYSQASLLVCLQSLLVVRRYLRWNLPIRLGGSCWSYTARWANQRSLLVAETLSRSDWYHLLWDNWQRVSLFFGLTSGPSCCPTLWLNALCGQEKSWNFL